MERYALDDNIERVGPKNKFDTNVLLTATDESRLQHQDAGRLLNKSGHRGLHLAASGQILREYLVVATRPLETNGLGLQVRDATANVTEFLRCIHLYDETEEVARRLRQLGLSYGLRGKRLHDANIVDTMSIHGIRTLVTQNPDDFAPFDEVDLVTVADTAM